MIGGVSPEVLGVVMLTLLVLTIMIGFPTAFSLMALGMIFGYLGLGDRVFPLIVQRTYASMTNDVLISVPLFIFMGYIAERAGILDRLFYSIRLAMGPVRGSLAIATLITSTIFGIAAGVVGASVTLMGLLALPAMLRAGYDVKYSTGIIAAGGTLGILIPPAVLFILYGATAGISVPRLYAAAFVPGFLLSFFYLVYIVVWAYIDPKIAPALPKEERNVPLPTILKELLVSSVPITLLTVIVLYVIVAGVATPTESAGIGAAGALLIAAIYRRVTWASMKESVFLTARTTALVGWLFVGSSLFAATFTILGGSALIERTVLGLGLRGDLFLWLSMATIFLLGWPLEWTEIIVIFIPLFLPLLDDFGIDPTFFGVMVAVNLQTAFLSPPVAMTAFYLKGVAPKHVTLNQIFQGMYPYMAIQVLCLVSLWLWPQIVTWLPDLIYGPAVAPRR